MKISKVWARIVSFVLILAMTLFMLPMNAKVAAAAAEEMNVNLHFYNGSENYDEVWLQYWEGSPTLTNSSESKRLESWGVDVHKLADEGSGWWYLTLTGSVGGIQFLNSNGTKNTGGSVYNPSMSQFTGDTPTDLYLKNKIWYTDIDCTNELKAPEAAKIYAVVGEIVDTKWDHLASKAYLNQVDNSSKYSITLENVAAGTYEFKILQDPVTFGWDKSWGGTGSGGNYVLKLTAPANVTLTIDSANVGSNIEVTLSNNESLVVKNKQVEKGSFVMLDTTGIHYDMNGHGNTVDVIYTLDTNDDAVRLVGYQLNVDKGFSGTEINLTATNAPVITSGGAIVASGSALTTKVKVDVVERMHTYTFYYYNQYTEMVEGGSDLYIFENGGGKNATVSLDELYQDNDNGIAWLKGSITLPYNKLGIIGRPTAGSWSGQDGNQYYELSDSNAATLWYIHGKGITTEKPIVKNAEKRYVTIEYIRPDGQYDGWNVYTWNSGYGSEVSVDFKETKDGRWVAVVPIMPTVNTLSFCVRKTFGNDVWGAKDGGDHVIVAPLNQTVIKSVMIAGSEPVLLYPYNIGYEIDTENERVNFYYRDDASYLEETLKGIENIQLYHDGKVEEMTYDFENQRFSIHLPLGAGQHYYYYIVNGKNILDKYNTVKENYDGVECSSYSYTKFNAIVNATISNTSINYNENAILAVDIQGVDGADLSELTVKDAYADLTSLGGKEKVSIDPQLMEVSISVRDTITDGVKTIPVTVMDQYGNKYTTNTSVKVVKKEANGDFDWDEAIIYFMLTDRFYDGNESNNIANGEYTYGDNPGLYHGGDFAGVTEKLDYLKDLGVNTIWISPIVENIKGTAIGSDVSGSSDVPYNSAYHGYWAKNFETLNPGFGTEEELRTLISAAHSKGIKIMVDIVLNHAGYGTEDIFADFLRASEDNISGDLILDSLSGLPDFATEKKEVRDQLIEWQTAWVEGFGIDYFRVDTLKHVDKTTWMQLKNELTKINPEFKMIGEYFGAGYANNFDYLGSGTMDSLLDFDFNDNVENFVKGNLESVEAFFETRNNAINNVESLGGFLSSHDEDGLFYRLKQAYPEDEARAKMMVAAALQITAKGQPVIYYGEEIGLSGANDYPYQTNRYDFDWSLVNNENGMFIHYKTLLAARNKYSKVFAKGERTKIAGSDELGFMMFNRSYQNQNLVVGLNVTNEEKSVTIILPFAKDATVIDEYGGNTYKAGKDGSLLVTIPAAQDGGCVLLAVTSSGSGNGNGNGNGSSPGPTAGTSSSANYIETIEVKIKGKDSTITAPITMETSIKDKKAGVSITLPTNKILEFAKNEVANVTILLSSEKLIAFLKEKEITAADITVKIDSKLIDSNNVKILELNLKKDFIAIIKETGAKINVTVDNEKGQLLYHFNFDGAEMALFEQEERDLNLALNIAKVKDNAELYKILKSYERGSTGCVVSFGETKKIPDGTNVKIRVNDNMDIKEGENVYLYHYNPKTQKLETMPKYLYQIDKDGCIEFSPKYGNDYILLPVPAGTKVKTSLVSQIAVMGKVTVEKGASKAISITVPEIINIIPSFDKEILKKVAPSEMAATVVYKSSNSKIAIANKKTGIVTGVSAGKAVIITTVTFKDGTIKRFKTTITVK